MARTGWVGFTCSDVVSSLSGHLIGVKEESAPDVGACSAASERLLSQSLFLERFVLMTPLHQGLPNGSFWDLACFALSHRGREPESDLGVSGSAGSGAWRQWLGLALQQLFVLGLPARGWRRARFLADWLTWSARRGAVAAQARPGGQLR